MTASVDTADEPSRSGGVQAGAGAGLRWVTFGRLALQLVGLGYMVALARLLDPAAYGVYGMAYVAVHLGLYLEAFKVEDALIQARAPGAAAWDAAWRFGLAWGAAAAVLLALTAPLVAWMFDDPAATPLVQGMAGVFVVRALGLVHRARLRRALRFKAVVGVRLAGLLAGGTVGVGAALAGAGAWSLVAYMLVQEAVAAAGAWWAEPWRPGRRGSRADLARLMRFGGPATVNDVAMYAQFNLVQLVVGRVFGAAPLGLYRVGSALAQRPLAYVQENTSQVAFPVFARMAEAPERLRGAFLAAFHLWVLAVAPIVMLLVVFARDLVDVVYGAQWLAVVPLLPLLAGIQASTTLQGLVSRLLLARGRPRIDLVLHAGAVLLLVPALWLAWPHGLATVLAAAAACFAAQNVAGLSLLGHWFGWTAGDVLRRLLPAGLTAAAVGVAVGGMLPTLGGWPSWARLLLGGALAGGAYLAVLALVDCDGVARIVRLAGFGRGRRAAA